jgi:4-alpha-glucanotransferase
MATDTYSRSVSRQRRAGVLLHPTSLPGLSDNGDLGHQAFRFIEFLKEHGFRVWQMLPLGPTHSDKSPYQCLSSHAGNPLLISLDWLEDRGWLDRSNIGIADTDAGYRVSCLQQAAENFYRMDSVTWKKRIEEFTRQHAAWLEDYALFIALKNSFQNKPWHEWPDAERHREPKALKKARSILKVDIRQIIFEQFIFFEQWQEIHDYAKQHGIELFGDMPIFVALDSADVWAERENFQINNDGEMACVAGVPPDAFSETGQRWGNPLYNWDHMKSTGFSWWKNRVATQLQLFDLVRVDHFRGLQACWQFPEDAETAMNGRWVEVPGRELLEELYASFQKMPLIAEDLGVITEKVIELKKMFDLPGMKVLQFAFDGNPRNPHLPHNHEQYDLVYTGTHDNDTTLGWVCDERNYNKRFFEEYTDSHMDSEEKGVWSMIRLAMSSVSFLCVLPMQDLLMLGSKARMNTPGTVGDNWRWRFEWKQIRPDVIQKLSRYMTLYQRY